MANNNVGRVRRGFLRRNPTLSVAGWFVGLRYANPTYGGFLLAHRFEQVSRGQTIKPSAPPYRAIFTRQSGRS